MLARLRMNVLPCFAILLCLVSAYGRFYRSVGKQRCYKDNPAFETVCGSLPSDRLRSPVRACAVVRNRYFLLSICFHWSTRYTRARRLYNVFTALTFYTAAQ